VEDTDKAKDTAETWRKFEDGYTGGAAVWKSSDSWEGRKGFLGRNKEVIDAELYAILMGLAAARDHKDEWATRGAKLITIFTDTQAALRHIRNDDPGPG
jgi:ribonuclease HI